MLLVDCFQKEVFLKENVEGLQAQKVPKEVVDILTTSYYRRHISYEYLWGRFDEENQTCFRCDEVERKKFLSVVTCEERMKISICRIAPPQYGNPAAAQ